MAVLGTALYDVALYGTARPVSAGETPPQPPKESVEQRLVESERKIADLQAQLELLRKELQALRSPATSGPDKGAKPALPPTSPRTPGTATGGGAAPASVSALSRQPHVFGWVQSQFENTNENARSRLFLRRVRLGVQGTFDDRFGYRIDADLSTPGGLLRDTFIEYLGWPGGSVRFGQFKVPYSLEALDSGMVLPLVERALVVDQLAFAHDRDFGIGIASLPQARGPLSYAVAVFNGAGRNQPAATSTHKLLAGRVEVHTPAGKKSLGGRLALGLATRQGEVVDLNRPVGARIEGERYGGDFDYLGKHLHIRAEYLFGRDRKRTPSGYYGLLDYKIRPDLEAVARYEGLDLGNGAPGLHRTTLGLNYAISKNTRAQLNYEFLSGTASLVGKSGLRIRLQTVFP
jgi:hypothetical protein